MLPHSFEELIKKNSNSLNQVFYSEPTPHPSGPGLFEEAAVMQQTRRGAPLYKVMLEELRFKMTNERDIITPKKPATQNTTHRAADVNKQNKK